MQDWVRKNQQAFERDVLRDFCEASDLLFEQFARFADSRTLSFPVLRALIGEPLNKGMLWRLKDKAHHIFLGQDRPEGLLLDWTLGYIFHETLKLMEDAHQRQYYAPQLRGLNGSIRNPEVEAVARRLYIIIDETSESMRREATRISTLILHSRGLFGLYFAGARDHLPLARFLHDNQALVRRAFGEDYEGFLGAVYGEEPERMHIAAALSLLESARGDKAAQAVALALVLNPDSREALEIKETHGL